MISKLKDLKEGKPVEVPIYDFKTHSRLKISFINKQNLF